VRIDAIEVLDVAMRLIEPFETSFGVEQDRRFSVVKLTSDGVSGFGECVAMEGPFYNEETVTSARDVIIHHLIPQLVGRTIDHPTELEPIFRAIRRNYMAKSAVETAAWDLYGQLTHRSLADLLGGVKSRVEVGISIGLQPSIDQLLTKVDGYLEQGFKRIKIKIKPGSDIELVRAIRLEFGDVPLMVDANSAYSLDDVTLLRLLDGYDLMMIEQPLAHDDIYYHAELARQISTPICLDESITSIDDLELALALRACSIVNLKVPRVGGLSASLAIEQRCRDAGIGLWCGGSLESGIGRLVNLAVASLPGFILPGDTAPSARYFHRDVLVEPVTFASPGEIAVPSRPGIGVEVDEEALSGFTVGRHRFDADF
jgi:O-succinylbenzoate synthase